MLHPNLIRTRPAMVALTLLVGTASFTGCASSTAVEQTSEPIVVSLDDARALPLHDGHTGESITWSELVPRLRSADIVLLGELHDDAAGHAFQRAVVRALTETHGSRFALAMEMLERHEQPLVDDYLEELISEDDFAELTFSSRWSGEGSWSSWYQPIIDEVKLAGGDVIAANAPRRYVRLARRDGVEKIEALDDTRRAFVELPMTLESDHYRKRFWRLAEMARERRAEENGQSDVTITIPDDDPGMVSFFRSQSVWDATMGTSTARAWLRDDTDCVALLVGQFHIEHDGGTAQIVRALAPDERILSITMQRGNAADDVPGEGAISDIVVRTD